MNFSLAALAVAVVLAVAPQKAPAMSSKTLTKGAFPWPQKNAPAVAKQGNAVPIPGCSGPLWNGQFPWMADYEPSAPECGPGKVVA